MGAEIGGFDLDNSKSLWWIRLARRIFLGGAAKNVRVMGCTCRGMTFPTGRDWAFLKIAR